MVGTRDILYKKDVVPILKNSQCSKSSIAKELRCIGCCKTNYIEESIYAFWEKREGFFEHLTVELIPKG